MKKTTRKTLWQFGHYWAAGALLLFLGHALLWVAQLPGVTLIALMDKISYSGFFGSALYVVLAFISIISFPFIFGILIHRVIFNFSPLRTLLKEWLRDDEPEDKAEENVEANV